MNSSIKGKLQDVFRDIFGDDKIQLSEEMNAQDIEGWDSLKHISVLAAVQDEFSISFDMDEIMNIDNIGDMIKSIEGKIK
ncbi:MAG: acyl carrier protein [Butyrivibrio sp.]|nr:acyl carrier protein [Butyrivibrio sp.]